MNRRNFLGSLFVAPVVAIAKTSVFGKLWKWINPCEHKSWYYHEVLTGNDVYYAGYFFCCADCGYRSEVQSSCRIKFVATTPPNTKMRIRYIDAEKSLD